MSTFIDDLESIVQEVALWGANEVKELTKALAPDGRPFGAEPKSIDEQLAEYRMIRNEPDAWQAWIGQKAVDVTNSLANSGVSSETISAINPVEVAISYALSYSAKMELELAKRMQ